MNEQRRRAQLILKFSFVASCMIYVVLAGIMVNVGTPPKQPPDPKLIDILTKALAIAYAVTVVFLAPLIKDRSQAGMVKRMACYQSGAVYGLVLFFLTYQLPYVLVFATLASVLLLTVPLPEE